MVMRATLIMLSGIAVHGQFHAEEPVYFADAKLKTAVENNYTQEGQL